MTKNNPETQSESTQEKRRIIFIDALRSVAILQMLQGHFISLSFVGYTSMVSDFNETGSSGYVLFDVWNFMRGLTAPLFFVASGLIFTWLLHKGGTVAKGNKRIHYGFRRGLLLIVLGYLLQVNLKYAHTLFDGTHGGWILGFHVLQCIGLTMMFNSALYWLRTRSGLVNLNVVYLSLTLFCFLMNPILNEFDTFPSGVSSLIQNIFKGQYSVFPLVPWSGYYFLGAFIGAIVFHAKDRVFSNRLVLVLALSGIGILLLSEPIYNLLGEMINSNLDLSKGYVLFQRSGQVLLLVAIFIWLEKKKVLKESGWLIIGRKTLWVYFSHVIVLYGGIFGFGLNLVIKHQLEWYFAVFGAIGFIFFYYGAILLMKKR